MRSPFVRYPNCSCKICAKPIYRRPREVERGRVYCSQSCYGKSQQKTNPCLVCGVPILASKHAKTCSHACSNKHRALIDSNQGGPGRPVVLDRAVKSRTMRGRLIATRGPICERCSYDKVKVLAAHHIVQRKDGGSDEPENLLLLCPNCHGEIHHGLRDSHGHPILSEGGVT